ncbi:hypothetical protein EF912_28335 [Streptomyces sp. WAC07061]|uniref:hypothetical protein n=1 Tax=Streptomyces sp. WAC07061 TaxID=2487410 RepID=UPI000F76F3C9|nr:hypothetical protein [Streptomyces sp. WAC07061]RSS45420.1 hypothetical protein EF912_28335 [Streptomyces sp. WAC07061]
MDMRAGIEGLAEEAEQQVRGHTWELAPADRVVASKAAADLHTAVGPPHVQEALPAVERLERLREALAVLAIALASVHGRLAWFLGAATTVLAPVLHWRALPVEGGSAFGTTAATPQQYADAEGAIHRLQAALTRITTT